MIPGQILAVRWSSKARVGKARDKDRQAEKECGAESSDHLWPVGDPSGAPNCSYSSHRIHGAAIYGNIM